MQHTRHINAFLICVLSIGGLAVPVAADEFDIPTGFTHQGYVEVNGQPFNGQGDFYFAIVETLFGTNKWTNDGSQLTTSNIPDTPVSLQVSNGVFSVSLGDGGMTDTLDLSTLEVGSFLVLRVWFDDGVNGVQQLTPDVELESVPYARAAESANDVRGEITADRVNYTTPRTHVVTVPATAFHPTDNDVSFSVTAEEVSTGGGNSLYAPVALPDGATITTLRVAGSNTLPDDPFNIELVAVEATPSPSRTVVVSTYLSPLAGDAIVSETGIDQAVDPDTAYSVVTDQPGLTLTGQMEIYWVKVEYTLSEAP